MLGIIYCANFPNGKKYYGRTKNSLYSRIQKHIRDAKTSDLLFHRALLKYDNMVNWSIIEKISIDLLNEREKYWIGKDKTNLVEYGYNLTEGGEGGNTFTGRKHSEETRRIMSESRKKWINENGNPLLGRKRPEHAKKISGSNNPNWEGKAQTEETKKKISEAKLGKKNTKVSDYQRGRKASPETKKKMSESRKGIIFTETHRKNLSKSLNGKKRKSGKCIYCGCEMTINMITRYHNEKCKYK